MLYYRMLYVVKPLPPQEKMLTAAATPSARMGGRTTCMHIHVVI